MKIRFKPELFSYQRLGDRYLRVIMRTFIFFSCSLVFATGADNQFFHNTEITINENKTLSIKNVFELIYTQTDYKFIYRYDLIKSAPDIDLKQGVIKAGKLLTTCLEPIGFTFEVADDETIIVVKNSANDSPHVRTILSDKIEQFQISGNVSDENGQPLPGANIVEKGTSNGVTADFDGNFTLDNVNGNAILEVSYIGFESKTITVNNSTNLNIVLAESAAGLDEVVVVGYGTQARRDVTGSITQVGADEYKDQPVTRVDQILQGRVAGVNVTNSSGAPGGTVSIRIRGSNSINGSNEPLYVIDGFVGADFKDVNPSDIQTLQVLKDASATAIYGSRGSNGVVLITTKSGRSGKPTISLIARASVSNIVNKWDVMNAATFAQVVNERAVDFGQPLPFTQSQIDDYRTNGGTDWQDELYRTGYGQEYQLNYSGGSENVSYFVSGNYLDQDGIVENSYFNKYSIRTNIKANITDKLTADIKMNYNRRESNNVSGNGDTSGALAGPLNWAPTTPARDELGRFTVRDPISSIKDNPLELANNDNISEISTIIANGSLNYEFIEGLSLNVGFGLSHSTINLKQFSLNQTGNNPSASRETSENLFVQNTNNLTYKKIFSDKHALTFTGVFENQTRKIDGFGTNGNNLLLPDFRYNNLTLVGSTTSNAIYEKETIISYIGRINYEFDSKYLFTASVRRDGSSKFRGNNQFSTFPSVALGWRISEESFMKDGFFDEFKLRGSWGQTGSQAISPFGTVTTLSSDNDAAAASFTNGVLTSGFVIGNPGNTDLKWETTDQIDLGVDISIFNSKLDFTFDYYKKTTNNLLLNQPLPSYVGGGGITKNIGSMDNNGYELGISASIVEHDNFQWNSTFNVAFLTNEIIDIGEQDAIFIDGGVGAGLTNLPENILTPGQSLSTYWGLKYLGTWKPDQATEAALYGNIPGDSRYEDLNGDNSIGGDDYQIIGQGMPKATYGWNNTFTYKDLTLNLFFNAMTNYDKWNFGYGSGVMPTVDSREAVLSDILNRYAPGNEDSNIPHFSPTNTDEIQSSRFVESGDFVRLKNLSLAYSIPKDMLNGVGIQVMLNATNVWTLTNYKGIDPEAYSNNGIGDAGGGDGGSYPNSKTWTLGVNFNF